MRRLKLLGGAAVEVGGKPLTGRATQRRRIALLSALAVGKAAVSREKLAALLWPESDTERSRHLLSDSVYRISQELGEGVIEASSAGLRLDPERLPSDLHDFEAALERGDDLAAADLYGGPFLDGFFLSDAPEFERWVDEQRSRLQQAAAAALARLATAAEAGGDFASAIDCWRRAAALDRHSARIAVRLIEALDAHGDRATGLQHARLFQRLLEEELGVGPDPTVAAAAERLRQAPTAGTPPHPSASEPAESPRGARPPDPRIPQPEDRPPRADPTTTGSSDLPSPGARPRRWWLGLAAAAVVTVGGWWAVRGRPGPDPNEPASILVLPFLDLSPERDAGHLADGVAEELISSLGSIPSLKVAARTSAFAYKGKPIDVREAARKLGANWVVEGSVRQLDRRLRVSVRLIDADDGYQLWSEDFDRELGDAFQIQREIAAAVVARLRGASAANRLAAARPVDFEGYSLYLKGRYAWHQRTEASLREAVRYFSEATERAPGYAPAHAGLGDAYAVLGFYDYLAPTDAFPRARAAAERALALDPDLAAAHATLGYVALYFDWDFAKGEADFQRSIALDPSYSTGHQWLGNLLTAAGRFDEAERAMRRAMELDPLSLIASGALAWVYLHWGRNDAAMAQARQTLELSSTFQLAYLWLGQAALAAGQDSLALSSLRRAATLSDRGAIQLAELAYAHASLGARDSASALLNEVVERGRSGGYVPAYEIAKAYLALGETATGRTWLERAFQERSHSMVFLLVDPELAEARQSPWLQELARRAGLVDR